MKWSRSHHGLTHLGDRSLTKTWVSVQDYTGAACLKVWYPGCQFTPELRWFTSVSKAKAEGEKVMRILDEGVVIRDVLSRHLKPGSKEVQS